VQLGVDDGSSPSQPGTLTASKRARRAAARYGVACMTRVIVVEK
jgi:hypothetical protein